MINATGYPGIFELTRIYIIIIRRSWYKEVNANAHIQSWSLWRPEVLALVKCVPLYVSQRSITITTWPQPQISSIFLGAKTAAASPRVSSFLYPQIPSPKKPMRWERERSVVLCANKPNKRVEKWPRDVTLVQAFYMCVVTDAAKNQLTSAWWAFKCREITWPICGHEPRGYYITGQIFLRLLQLQGVWSSFTGKGKYHYSIGSRLAVREASKERKATEFN